MGNKNPKCRMVSLPREFMPLLEKELDEGGYFSYAQLMGTILAEHFKVNMLDLQGRIDKSELRRVEDRDG